MIWAIYCIDVAGSRPLRDEHRLAHRAYLKNYASRIFFSGPLWDDALYDQAGSLFLIELAGRAEAKAFMASEPYNGNGVFESVRIMPMTKGHFNPELSGEKRERPEARSPTP